jgi:hypothetical protein
MQAMIAYSYAYSCGYRNITGCSKYYRIEILPDARNITGYRNITGPFGRRMDRGLKYRFQGGSGSVPLP